MTDQSDTWLTENEVVMAVATHLQKDGWRILHTKNTSEQGIDLLATRDGVTLAVEAKGGGSSKRTSARYGKPFDTAQKRVHVGEAVLSALRETSGGQHQAALALPDNPTHVRFIEGIGPALQKLNIAVYFVALDKSVRTHSLGARG